MLDQLPPEGPGEMLIKAALFLVMAALIVWAVL
jgi:hypothetical protein